MTFALFHTGRASGRPIELYRFTYGPALVDVIGYTDAEFPVTFEGLTYTPLPILREVFTNSGTLDRSAMTIAMPHTASVPQLFRVYPPNFVVRLTIYQGEGDDPDQEFLALWSGRVLSVSYEGVEAKITCDPISTTLTRVGLRRNYQYLCPHMLYGPKCKADKAAATVSRTVSSFSGRTISISSGLSNPDRYEGGYVEWVGVSGRNNYRSIASVVSGGTLVNLAGPVVDLANGATISLRLGCRHTLESCRDDHDNANNHGGFKWIPLKNPLGAVSPFQ